MGKLVRTETSEGIVEVDVDARTQRVLLPNGDMISRPYGSPVEPVELGEDEESDHNENLAEHLDDNVLNAIASELLQAIATDWQSSQGRRQDLTKALALLAIRVEEKTSTAVDGQSVIRSPLLLEAVLGFQANAVAELLPASGPVKMRYDGDLGEDDESMQLTEDLERDFNHYLTTVASEYYPDTTRMLFDDVDLAGSGFKKVFRCPLRRRPVSESVSSADLIVNAGTTDLGNAQRITQRLQMAQSVVKRLQLSGHYLNVNLVTPTEMPTALDEAKAKTQGLGAAPQIPNTHRFTLYECYCEYDVPGYQHKKDGKVTGLPLPYRVTIETLSQKVLEVRRDWKEDDEHQMRRKTFVKYPFVEALGFYGIGLMHILGNTTEAMTAAWRILLDAGMFSNFPGFLYAKDASKSQETNVLRVAPGTGKGIQTGGRPIDQVVMPLPYKAPDQSFIALSKLITEAAQRCGGTPQLPIGEGKQEAPVGTTIALLEQATKMMSAVHKGLHAAQAEEFQMLKELFREDPESFWIHSKKRARKWDSESFLRALEDNDIVPSADPNTPSHMHRIMRAVGLVQLATSFPELANLREVLRIAVEVLGWDPDVVLAPPPEEQAPQPPPELPIDRVGMAAVEAKKAGDQLSAQVKLKDIQSREAIEAAKLRQKSQSDAQKLIAERQKLQLETQREHVKLQGEQQKMQMQHQVNTAKHAQEREKLAQQARMGAMKQMGLGTRVI